MLPDPAPCFLKGLCYADPLLGATEGLGRGLWRHGFFVREFKVNDAKSGHGLKSSWVPPGILSLAAFSGKDSNTEKWRHWDWCTEVMRGQIPTSQSRPHSPLLPSATLQGADSPSSSWRCYGVGGITNEAHSKSQMNVCCPHTQTKLQLKELKAESVSALLQTLWEGGRDHLLLPPPHLENTRRSMIPCFLFI